MRPRRSCLVFLCALDAFQLLSEAPARLATCRRVLWLALPGVPVPRALTVSPCRRRHGFGTPRCRYRRSGGDLAVSLGTGISGFADVVMGDIRSGCRTLLQFLSMPKGRRIVSHHCSHLLVIHHCVCTFIATRKPWSTIVDHGRPWSTMVDCWNMLSTLGDMIICNVSSSVAIWLKHILCEYRQTTAY